MCAGWGVFCSHVNIAVFTPSNYACNSVYTNCDPFLVVLILTKILLSLLNFCSTTIGPRHPLKRDPSLNYEVDSDEEWEEVAPSLSPAPNSVHMLVENHQIIATFL